MSMTGVIQTAVRKADATIARAYLSLFRERSALMTFLFHSVFRNEQEMDRCVCDPLDRITVPRFRQFIEHYLRTGYQFVTPGQLLNGLPARGKYALITFDDGYYNNTLIHPILEEFNVPALFFISTNHVLQQKCFWWDVLYREQAARGCDPEQIKDQANALKHLRTEDIEAQLIQQFGPDALKPRCDIDRPFTADELREFASSPLVHLGNHTANHGILTNYPAQERRRQIQDAQSALRQITGTEPTSIAYPNGGYTNDIVSTCQQMGLKLGFTIRPGKTALPLNGEPGRLLRLERFCFYAEDSIECQCQMFRSDVQMYGTFRNSYLKLRKNEIPR
jgi:peptidoglycan/xylan/chitin deacetylase (PgdA/CDA1 family)